MKNNIRYTGNINSTSVIIFLKSKSQKLLERLLFCDVVVFISFDLHFAVVLHFVVVFHLSMFFIHIFFSTSSLTIPRTIVGFLHPFYTFSPAHRRVIRDTFIFNHSVIFLPRALRVLSRHFLPTGVFYLTLLHRHFTCVYQRLPSLGAGSSFLRVTGLHTDP